MMTQPTKGGRQLRRNCVCWASHSKFLPFQIPPFGKMPATLLLRDRRQDLSLRPDPSVIAGGSRLICQGPHIKAIITTRCLFSIGSSSQVNVAPGTLEVVQAPRNRLRLERHVTCSAFISLEGIIFTAASRGIRISSLGFRVVSAR